MLLHIISLLIPGVLPVTKTAGKTAVPRPCYAGRGTGEMSGRYYDWATWM